MQQQLGSDEVQQISRHIGADPTATRNAIEAALPMIVGGIAARAQQPSGAENIQSLLASHAGLLDNLGSLLGAGPPADGGAVVGSVLGPHQDTVQAGVQQASGLDSERTRKLLLMLAPIVLGALAKRHAEAAQTQAGGDVRDVLNEEAEAARQHSSSTHVGGLLGKILSHVQTPPA